MKDGLHAHRTSLTVGCQRSGTTLLHLILDSHSQIDGFDEDRLPILQQYISAPGVPISKNRLVSFKLPAVANPWEPALPLLFQVPGQVKYLFITRHVFDVVVSMCELKHTRLLPNNSLVSFNWLDRSAERFARLRFKTASLPTHLEDRLVFAATWWAEHNRYWMSRSADLPMLHLTYEDLVSSPRLTLQRVLDFLGVPWEESVLHHPSKYHDPGIGTVLGGTNPNKPIHQESYGRWRKYLSVDDQRKILDVCRDLVADLGYETFEQRSPCGR